MSDPQQNWEPIETEEEVVIPPSNGQGVAEVIKVTVPAFKDPKSGEIYLGEEALRILGDVRARHAGLLTTQEIRSLRKQFGYTQKQMSERLMLGEKTWTRWESGRDRPSRSMNLLLRALQEGRIDMAWLSQQQEPGSRCVPRTIRVEPRRYHMDIVAFCGALHYEPAQLPGLEHAVEEQVAPSEWMMFANMCWPVHDALNLSPSVSCAWGYQRSVSRHPFANAPEVVSSHICRGQKPIVPEVLG